ncbi:MAG: DUF2993 domain-containing protein [Cyanobacteria bacterium P01_A01_bin.114]
MFGNLPFSAGQGGGDQLVSKAAKGAISALLKQTDALEVNVRAEPVAKLLQGSVDGFDFIGNGLKMHSGLQVEGMEMYVQAVAIDFGAIFKGQVKLRQPTQASMRIVLTEEDLTVSFNTPFLVEKLQTLQHQGESLNFVKTQITVNDDQSMRMQSQVRPGEAAEPVDVDITARLEVKDRRQIQFVEPSYGGDDQAVALGKVLTDHVNGLLDLDQFALEGMQLRVDRLRLRDKKMTLYGNANIEKFPQR